MEKLTGEGKLSVFIPSYNEEGIIKHCIDETIHEWRVGDALTRLLSLMMAARIVRTWRFSAVFLKIFNIRGMFVSKFY